MGDRTGEDAYDPNGSLVKTRQRVYNSLAQLYQDIGASSAETTTYGYDANGNLSNITDPLSHQTVNGYDALNRLTSVTDPGNGITHYGYDPLDQLTGVTDPRSLVTNYSVDALGNRNTQHSPDSGNGSSTYDAAGNTLTRTDAKNQTTHYQYDALNRPTQITAADSSLITYTYDQGSNGIGHLSSMSDPSGTTTWSYDAHGRAINKVQGIDGYIYTTAYAYDSSGQLSSMTLPSFKRIVYTWTNGRITALTLNTTSGGHVTATPLLTNISWQPFGGPTSWTLANGETDSRSYDLDGRIIADPVNAQIGYDAASRITSLGLGNHSLLTDNKTFGYDALDRLTSYTGSGGPISYTYDANGNRSQQTVAGTTTSYTVDPASNRVTRINNGKLAYDANGSRTSLNTTARLYSLVGRIVIRLPRRSPGKRRVLTRPTALSLAKE